MFDTFDRTGSAEFPFPKQVVFRALCEAVPLVPGVKIEGRDELACRLDLSTGMSAFSWGEKISVSASGSGDQSAVVSVQSAAKTIFGSATVHGKNRRNVRDIIEQTSKILTAKGEGWRRDLGLDASHKATSGSIVEDLAKLAALRNEGLLDEAEFVAAKARLLSE
jgi:hypothetical protein